MEEKKVKMPFPVIDMGLCTLCLGCVDLAPGIFRYNRETGLIEVVDLSEYPHDLVEEAIKNCPEKCISWETW